MQAGPPVELESMGYHVVGMMALCDSAARSRLLCDLAAGLASLWDSGADLGPLDCLAADLASLWDSAADLIPLDYLTVVANYWTRPCLSNSQ